MSDPATKAVTINVQGMSCQGCVGKVLSALQATPGVLAAAVSLERSAAQITFDPALVSVVQLMKVVTTAGFKAAGFAVGG